MTDKAKRLEFYRNLQPSHSHQKKETCCVESMCLNDLICGPDIQLGGKQIKLRDKIIEMEQRGFRFGGNNGTFALGSLDSDPNQLAEQALSHLRAIEEVSENPSSGVSASKLVL